MRAALPLSCLLLATILGSDARCQSFSLSRQDHVCYIGNNLADRMQHHGWLETYLHALHPSHQLVFRNLGFTGDEIQARPRSMDFGSPNEWLAKCQADVVFCFFGYNEALRGAGGLNSFKQQLNRLLREMRDKPYNGSDAARLVVFGPIAHENLNSPYLPDGTANNANLSQYNDAMRDISAAHGVRFVDLFEITSRLYALHEEPLTMNGVHLLDNGNRLVARAIVSELFPNQLAAEDEQVSELRAAVLEKNYYWFSRYRVVDGYNVYGGRSRLAWHGQSNADVMRREMEIFDVMTQNRDRRIWAVAQGGEHTVVDDNLPDEIEVTTNKEGPLERGAFPYLGGNEAIEAMQVHNGLEVNLFASEERFPRLINPVQMAVDTDSRLWVSVWPSYPHWNPTNPREDALLIFPDEDADGVADDCIVFADELNSVTGFEFWGGGVIVAAPPELWFLKDTDGDDRADLKLRILQGISSADTHHSANAMVLGPDGWLYWSRGIFNVTNIETPTKTFRSTRSGVYRFNPRTFEVEFHFPIGPNPHGHVFDRWGFEFANDGTSGTGSYVNIGRGHGNKQWFQKRVRPVAATGLLSSSHFPDEMQGNFLICNVISVLGVLNHEVSYDGADILATEVDPLVVSDDPNFRPSDLEIGGDGALYIADWHNALIGHMQHNMRDPNRDDTHGRIYRLSCPDRALLTAPRMKDRPVAEVCEQFFAKENGTRYRARLELSGRDPEEMIPQLFRFLRRLNVRNDDPDRDEAQALLECLWVFEEHRAYEAMGQFPFMALMTASEPRIRAAVVRSAGHYVKQLPPVSRVIRVGFDDDSPLVQAEAIKSAVELPRELATELLTDFATKSLSGEVLAVFNYARAAIELDQWLAERLTATGTLEGNDRRYVLKFGGPDLIAQLPESPGTLQALIRHPDTSGREVRNAVSKLTASSGVSGVRVLARLISESPAAANKVTARWALILAEQPQQHLKKALDDLRELALRGSTQMIRIAGFRAWVAASGASSVFAHVESEANHLTDFLTAFPQFAPEEREAMLPALMPLAERLPTEIDEASRPGLHVDYFSPHPQDAAAETLNQQPIVTSFTTPDVRIEVPPGETRDDFALRFNGMIEIRTPGEYIFSCESDDGSRVYLDDVLLIDNDGHHGVVKRSASIELASGQHQILVTYFDQGGDDGLRMTWTPPDRSEETIPPHVFTHGGRLGVDALAVQAIRAVPGSDSTRVDFFVSLLERGDHIGTAVRALADLDSGVFNDSQVNRACASMLDLIRETPVSRRTERPILEAIALTRQLTTHLADRRALEVNTELDALEVQVVALGVVPHKMMFDQETLVVQAGRAVEVRFTNVDAMPHNFVLTHPGALEQVGRLSDATGRNRDAIGRGYVPESDQILAASTLLQAEESASVKFVAPSEPGVYPFVCTYPGHWRRMFGALVVVADRKAYEAEPSRYLVENSIEPEDVLLRSRRDSHAWTYGELERELSRIESGRSYDAGKVLFRTATCVGCHSLESEGQVFGPDLSKLSKDKSTYEHLLRSIVEPSAAIESEYQQRTFYLDSGKLVTGMVLEQTDDQYKVLVGPMGATELCDDSAIIVHKSEVEEQAGSRVSLMPAGLLDQLTPDEILDLIAYVYAKGNSSHPIFANDGRAE